MTRVFSDFECKAIRKLLSRSLSAASVDQIVREATLDHSRFHSDGYEVVVSHEALNVIDPEFETDQVTGRYEDLTLQFTIHVQHDHMSLICRRLDSDAPVPPYLRQRDVVINTR